MLVEAKIKLCLFSLFRENKINQIYSTAAWRWPEDGTITVNSYFSKFHEMQNTIKAFHLSFAQMADPVTQNHMGFSRVFPRTLN